MIDSQRLSLSLAACCALGGCYDPGFERAQFLCASAEDCGSELVLLLDGLGSGSVEVRPSDGLVCEKAEPAPKSCAFRVDPSPQTDLLARPAPGAALVSWTGCVSTGETGSGEPRCTTSTLESTQVGATFGFRFGLALRAAEGLDPAGIAAVGSWRADEDGAEESVCGLGQDCRAAYAYGERVIIDVNPVPPTTVRAWHGCAAEAGALRCIIDVLSEVAVDVELGRIGCGSGELDLGEDCDDGNLIDGDGCDSNCTPTGCGNGIVTGNEQCDDGADDDDDGCVGGCVIARCGDGFLRGDGAEECDDGNELAGDGCTECVPETGWSCDRAPGAATRCTENCGDGIVVGSEGCDDGGTIPGDGCFSNCVVELGYVCPIPGAACATLCGDGLIRGREGCDDGNLLPDDGCGTTCSGVEAGFTCSAPGQACAPICGDSRRLGVELCDDSNTLAGDGCSSSCAIEPGWRCLGAAGASSTCSAICGDGLLAGPEACDDANELGGDGCDATCAAVEVGFACALPGDPCTEVCGDRRVVGRETCDDGNLLSDDGCRSDCIREECGDGTQQSGGASALELSWLASSCLPTSASSTVTFTVNGLVAYSGPGAPSGCSCYPGIQSVTIFDEAILDELRSGHATFTVRLGEGYQEYLAWVVATITSIRPVEIVVFDAWGGHDADSRNPDWCYAGGMDGGLVQVLDTDLLLGEECEDGNLNDGDGCSATCGQEVCGNQRVDFGEDCDDGNAQVNDGCRPDCTLEVCGDGIADAWEECDDGNLLEGDGCSMYCGVEVCGNGVVNFGEACDDGNGASGDGCTAACVLEVCGDGVVQSGLVTSVQFQWVATGCLSGAPAPNITFSVNGVVAYTGVGATAGCYCNEGIRSAWVADPAVLALVDASGDTTFGVLLGTSAGDYLAWATATVYTLQGSQEVVIYDALGGNDARYHNPELCNSGYEGQGTERLAIGHLTLGEACDDGGAVGGDGCAAWCLLEACPNGRVDVGEACDDGNGDAGDGCTGACSLETGYFYEVEPNDTSTAADGHAAALPLGGHAIIGGELTATDARDRFRVDPPGTGVIRVEAFGQFSPLDCGSAFVPVSLLTAGGPVYADYGSGIGACSSVVYPLPTSDALYVEIGPTYGRRPYAFEVSFHADQGSEVEPNDQLASATVVAVSGDTSVLGSHLANDDADYFAISVPGGASVRAEVIEGDLAVETCESLGVDSRLTLLTDAGVAIADDDDDGRGYCSKIDGTGTLPDDIGAHRLAAGTYYLQVRASSLSQTGDQGVFSYRLAITLRAP